MRDPQKGPAFFPHYWAMLCWNQKIPDDSYVQKIANLWLDDAGGLWDHPASDNEDGDRDSEDRFRMGPSTAYWTCPDWFQDRLAMLRISMIAGDETMFRRRRSSIRCLVNSVLREVGERLIYRFEGGRAPAEDIADEKEWDAPELLLPDSPSVKGKEI